MDTENDQFGTCTRSDFLDLFGWVTLLDYVLRNTPEICFVRHELV